MKFHIYRLSLVPQLSYQLKISFDGKTKEQRFVDLIEEIKESKKMSFSSRNTKFTIYYVEELKEGTHGFSLAREDNFIKPVEGDTSIEELIDVKTPFIHIIVDQKSQIVLIQEKLSVFNDITTPVKRVEEFLNNKLRNYDINNFLEPITENKDFWQEVETLDSISEFDIMLTGPNLFGGRQKAADVVKSAYEEFNISEFEIKLKNKFNQLKLSIDAIGDFVALVAAGAGKYTLKAMKDGKKISIKSYQFIKSKFYDIETLNAIDREQLRNDLNEFNYLNDDITNQNNTQTE
jgi:hypothetical protein